MSQELGMSRNRSSALLLLTALSIIIVSPGRADPTSVPTDSADGVFGEGTTGNGQPDNKTGVMRWSYSFELAKARGRPQPRLGLSYNSSSRDRDAGYGWGLELPVIEIRPLSGNPCFELDGTPVACWKKNFPHVTEDPNVAERYTFNGQPLVFICQLPAPAVACEPNQKDEPQPDWTANGKWRYFRLQVEGEFSRFYLSENRRLWRVQLKGGQLLEFGELADSVAPSIEPSSENNNAVLRWRLTRQSDAVHPANFISYRWKLLGKRGLLYLTDIFDTPRANGPQSDADFAHHTHLTWELPSFPQTFYADPFRATPDLRLSQVAVASMPWSGVGPREIIRTYFLSYIQEQKTEPTLPTYVTGELAFSLWHHSFLSKISIEGRCALFENSDGNPPSQICPQNPMVSHRYLEGFLPPTTFEYQGAASIGLGAAYISEVSGGPNPPNAINPDHVLPYLNSVAVVDFNRDGLPDIVQSWNAEVCGGVDAINKAGYPIRVLPNADQTECAYKSDFGPQYRPFQSVRPISGYLNQGFGNGSVHANFDYQCMDAGKLDDPTGLTAYNLGQLPGFFSSSSATLVGSWSYGVIAWSKAKYAPYRARPLPQYATGEFQPGTGCDPDHFNGQDFFPGWKWEQIQTGLDWAKLPNGEPDSSAQQLQPRWFADIDGDGLIDRLVGTGMGAGPLESATAEFTSVFGRGDKPQLANALGFNTDHPAEIPFVWNGDDAISLAPSRNSPAAGAPCSNTTDPPASVGKRTAMFGCEYYTKFYYVDINGDGLVDLVLYNPANAYPPQVRLGDGKGNFSCDASKQPWPCLAPQAGVSPAYQLDIIGPSELWNVNDEDIYFHDVTGDGLADIIKYNKATGKIRLWVNLDGHTFACVTGSTSTSTGQKDCTVQVLIDERTGTSDIGEHKITFADMDGDGTDDIVVLAHRGAYIGRFMNTSIATLDRGWAPKPGVLTRIHNGYGATTDIQYHTLQQIDKDLKGTKLAWKYHAPVVESVVTQIVTQDAYHAEGYSDPAQMQPPYRFRRKFNYIYLDPAYDRWSRTLSGFRKIIAHSGDELAATATTYWFGPCQNNSLITGDVPVCPNGSDDDDFKSITGRVVRVDRANLEAFGLGRFPIKQPRFLWTKLFRYVPDGTLFNRTDRRVTFSYPSQIETYLYDDAIPTAPGGNVSPMVGWGQAVDGADELEDAPHQPGVRRHLRSSVEYDASGNLRRKIDYGAVKDADSPSDVADEAVTSTLFSSSDPVDPHFPPSLVACTFNWQCAPDYVSVWQPTPTLNDSDQANLLRKSHFIYLPVTHDVASIQGWLQGSQPLDRHHPDGNAATAPPPAGQSLNEGWHTLTNYVHDTWGNVVRSESGRSLGGAPVSCTSVTYDEPYQQLPSIVRAFKNGCESSALETQNVFDRGFAVLVSSIAPNGSVRKMDLDPFGRPKVLYSPNIDGGSVNKAPVLSATIDYVDQEPLSYVDVKQVIAPGTTMRSVTILNGLLEPAVTFEQGDNNDWVADGWRETNASNQITRAWRPWSFAGDPVALALQAGPISKPSNGSFFAISYDDFGRKSSVSETGATSSLEIGRTKYFPLSLETRDAEQLKAGGQHAKAFTRVEFDGRGRTVKSTEHIENPTSLDILTTVKYDAAGEPESITREHSGSVYQRTMQFDSLGRLVFNSEPNTGMNWRYVWDDAGRLIGTSDARGCGANLYYDGLNRLIGKDYSPCLRSQETYSSPNLVTGEGLETFYRYDVYENDQLNPEPGFADEASTAIGKLVAVFDRGSHVRFSYDDRGRLRRISRQMAKPELSQGIPTYAPHWFTSRLDYDLGDRLTRKTSGVDVPDLLINDSSEERYAYYARSLVYSIGSSYGDLVGFMSHEPDRLPKTVVYGDFRRTTAQYSYDEKRQLINYQLGAPSSGPSLPIEHFNFHYSAYDDVGNPLTIEDLRTPWTPLPADAAPVKKRTLQYDDLYRLAQINNTYTGWGLAAAPWLSPFAYETSIGDHHPVPPRAVATRIDQQNFTYDGLGNLKASSDNLNVTYDRSLGTNIGYGSSLEGPNQLRSGQGLQARYDSSGNLTELKLERSGNCPTGSGDQCAQWFTYDWDEVGQLARARRWDFNGNTFPEQIPSVKPSWELTYGYSQGGRVRKSLTDASGASLHSLDIFDTLRVQGASFNSIDGNYEASRDKIHAYLGGIAHVFWDQSGQLPHVNVSGIAMNVIVADHLGSNSVVVNHTTSELVERTTYQPYGAVENDYRPAKWKLYRESYKFTGKEEDIEIGAINLGARYYQPYLGRFMSPDPLTIHGLASDLNPYAYVGGRVSTNVDPRGLDGETPEQPEDSCHSSEMCGTPLWLQELQASAKMPPTDLGQGSTLPPSPEPVPVEKATVPFNPTKDSNWLDRWILEGSGLFHDTLTSDTNLRGVQYAAGGVAIAAATIATGGLALEAIGAAGITAEGFGATVLVNAGRAASAFTEASLAEQGIAIGGTAGAGTILASEAAPAAQRLIPASELITRRITAGSGSYRGITPALREWALETYAKYGGTGAVDVAHITEHVFTAPGQSILVRPQAAAINRAEGALIRGAAGARREYNLQNPSVPLQVR
jgi:RHS repeat-associated protein